MAKDKRITLHVSENKKDIIKLKAQNLNLSISDFLCLAGKKIKKEDFLKKILSKKVEKNDKKHKPEKKGWITFRSSEEDLSTLEKKAEEVNLTMTEYLVSLGLKVDLEVNFKEKK